MTSSKPRLCAGGCGRKVAPPARKCAWCKRLARRLARHHSGGGWSRGGAARVLASSSPGSSPLSVGPINPSACPEAECRFCGFPLSRCYCVRETLADLASELDVLCTGQERFAGDPAQSPFTARIVDVMDRIEARL